MVVTFNLFDCAFCCNIFWFLWIVFRSMAEINCTRNEMIIKYAYHSILAWEALSGHKIYSAELISTNCNTWKYSYKPICPWSQPSGKTVVQRYCSETTNYHKAKENSVHFVPDANWFWAFIILRKAICIHIFQSRIRQNIGYNFGCTFY